MTFNRIIFGHGWPDAPQGDVSYPAERVLSDATVRAAWTDANRVNFRALCQLPTLFMAEGKGADDYAHVGSVVAVTDGPKLINLRYQYDMSIPPIPQDRLSRVATELGLSSSGRGWDWTTTHWTVIDADLYRLAFRLAGVDQNQNTPRVFQLSAPPKIDPYQLSAMMPFDAGLRPVYAAIEAAGHEVGMQCHRADNIWENHHVIQDVVSLIDRSRVVVCDLTGRNANVFYEAGIAHALGREVILITQHPTDVPFDLSHIRYLQYQNNEQGWANLQAELVKRLRTLLARTAP